MTIQFGRPGLFYAEAQTCGPRLRWLIDAAKARLRARQARIDKQSVVAILIRRWLLAPALTGVLLGMLMQ